MEDYVFEIVKGGLNQAKVEKIICEAGYNPGDFSYSELSKKSVCATGDVVMNVNNLENAARRLGYKTVSVSSNAVIKDVVERTAANPLGATNYSVSIQMDAHTVSALSAGNYSLYGFKAVQSSVGGGAPLVWFQSNKYGTSTNVGWEVQYQAYTSQSDIIPGGEITGLSPYNIDLAQKLSITTPQGTGSVGAGNTPLGIEILNETTTPVTCGISEVVEGKAEPLCAFPLYGNGLDSIVPIQKVMLTFATKQVNTGTVIEKAYSQSILIDLTSANSRTVTFDINNGWSWGQFAWAQSVAANSNVAPLLIEDNAGFAAGARTLLG